MTDGVMVVGSNNITNRGVGDTFVFKLDSAGTDVWLTGIGSSGIDRPTAIAVDEANSYVYVTGHTYGSTLTVGSTTYTETNSGDKDVFLIQVRRHCPMTSHHRPRAAHRH